MHGRKPVSKVAAVAAAAAVAVSLSACSGGGGGQSAESTVTWSTWGTAEELERYNEFNQAFMERHPDITVKMQPVAAYGEYHPKLLAQLASNTAPDVFYVGDDKIGEFVDSGRLMGLTELMESPDSQTTPEDFFPGLFGAAERDGEIYGAPNDSNPDLLWYDRSTLEAAGIEEDPAELAANGEWTTEKFLEMNDELAQAGIGGTMFWNYWATHWSWLASQGAAEPYDASGAFVAGEDAESVKLIETLGEYFQDGKFLVADTLPEGAGADSLFVTGKAGFFVQGRYTIGLVNDAGTADNVDVVRWPTPDGQPAPTGVAVSYLAINKAAEDTEAAFTFWTEFLSAEGQTERLSGDGNAVPSIAGADDVVLEAGYPANAQAMIDARDIGFVNYAAESVVPGLPTDIADIFLKLYEGKQDAQATLDEIAALVAEKSGR